MDAGFYAEVGKYLIKINIPVACDFLLEEGYRDWPISVQIIATMLKAKCFNSILHCHCSISRH